jgi:hypothetical protein
VCTAHGFIDSTSEVIRMVYASVKRARIVVCGFVFCLALVVVAWAQANEPLDVQIARSEARGFTGVVVSVDPESRILVVRGEDGLVMAFRLDYAKFKMGFGVPDQVPEQLQTGESVAIRYATVEQTNFATLIGKD